jgi:ferritin-like metal-binding protein YciE
MDKEDAMNEHLRRSLQAKVCDYLEDAHALEQGAMEDLDSMMRSIQDSALKGVLERHRQVSRQHAERLLRRLGDLERELSVRRRVEGAWTALMKSVTDAVRTDAASNVGRDVYLLAHAKIASYELLERLATEVGDDATGELARAHLAQDERMAEEIAERWDDFFRQALADWRSAEPVESTPSIV